MPKAKNVHIVKIKDGSDSYHIVEEENSGKFLFKCDTQKQGIDWAISCGFTYEIHRERNKKPSDQHGQFRDQ
ncbi:hypothetical protein [Dickeya undicola]|uniref:hypothetical protein n=1 Tax=Dickeya undicola TaxID=1577887 RepID=UPI00126A3948|nr:hypothetical protein [Dickeya undicola]